VNYQFGGGVHKSRPDRSLCIYPELAFPAFLSRTHLVNRGKCQIVPVARSLLPPVLVRSARNWFGSKIGALQRFAIQTRVHLPHRRKNLLEFSLAFVLEMRLGVNGHFMKTKPNSTFSGLRLRAISCLCLFAATGAALLIPTRSTPARPTPTPRPLGTPCEGFPPRVWDVTVGQGLAFVPNTLTITAGDTVCWNWASNGHSVTSGINCMANGWFCSPDNINCSQGILSDTGTEYCVTFNGGWVYYYFCAAHCTMGMTGMITVSPKQRRPGCP